MIYTKKNVTNVASRCNLFIIDNLHMDYLFYMEKYY